MNECDGDDIVDFGIQSDVSGIGKQKSTSIGGVRGHRLGRPNPAEAAYVGSVGVSVQLLRPTSGSVKTNEWVVPNAFAAVQNAAITNSAGHLRPARTNNTES